MVGLVTDCDYWLRVRGCVAGSHTQMRACSRIGASALAEFDQDPRQGAHDNTWRLLRAGFAVRIGLEEVIEFGTPPVLESARDFCRMISSICAVSLRFGS